MTILITGSNGFLGSYLLKRFVNSNFKVIALKRSSSDIYRIEKFIDKVTYYDIDKIDIKSVFKNNNIDVVIHTATNYGRVDKELSSIVNTNVVFSLKILEESLNSKIKAFINTDTLLERTINNYSLSKAQFVDWMKALSNCDAKLINIKVEHMYGPLDDENKFIYWLIKQIKSNIEKIDLTSGIQKRDFIYIDDIVDAYEIIVKNIDRFENYEEFELGYGNSIEVKKFIDMISFQIAQNQLVTTKLNFGAIQYRKHENMNMKADITKLRNLGWNPKIDIENGIKQILKVEQ
jgi:nucleoside-diphosphate-sugar epimerase